MLPGFIRRSRLVFFYKRIAAEPDFLFWKLKGSPQPKVPHLIKQRTLREYALRFQLPVLIETGTQFGQMIGAMEKYFRDIYSIELDDINYALATKIFANHTHIHLLHGDSAVELPKLLQSISEPCLFWLDGHSDETPIMEELRAVFSHGQSKHVILIDDANCFGSSKFYPTMDAVRDLTSRYWPGATVEVRDNIIRIHQT
jgi:hypothetical protein